VTWFTGRSGCGPGRLAAAAGRLPEPAASQV